jgi:large subunit ribosomal protein L4
MKLPILTNTGISGDTKVASAVFEAEVNKVLLAQAVLVYRSNLRQGTASTKTRSAVTATTKKWFRQKGTGNARHGAKSAPIFVGGGVAHGPVGNANWSKKLTKKLKSSALVSALSAQAKNIYVSSYINELTGKTQEAAALLAPLKESGRILVIVHQASATTMRALKNLDEVLVIPAYQVTALEVVLAHKIVISPEAVSMIEQRVTTDLSSKKTTSQTQKESPLLVKKTSKKSQS